MKISKLQETKTPLNEDFLVALTSYTTGVGQALRLPLLRLRPQGPVAVHRRPLVVPNSAVFRFDLWALFQLIESEPKSDRLPIKKMTEQRGKFVAIT